MNVIVARRMKGTQLVMTLNRSVWTMQSSPHVYRSSIMIDGNLCATLVIPLTLRLLMSYIYGAHILDVSRSHTTTHHSR